MAHIKEPRAALEEVARKLEQQQQQQRHLEAAAKSAPDGAGPTSGGPDSGRAWLVLALMFLINSSVGGANRVYGLVYARQVADGYYSHQEASWPISTASAVENLAGILTPALAQFLSWRQIQLLSTSLFVLANLGAHFSDSLALDILCLGLVQGLAQSMSTLLGLAINNHYFARYRTTAYGLGMCGGTCGILYMGPLVSWLLERRRESFRLVYLVLALIFTLNYPAALLITPRKGGEPTPPAAENSAGSPLRKRSRFEAHFERKNSVASISMECRLSRHSTPSRGSRNWLARAEPEADRARGQQPPSQAAQPVGNTCDAGPDKAPERPADWPQAGQAKAEEAARARQQPAGEEFSLRSVAELLRSPYLHCVWFMLALYYLISRVLIIVLTDFAADRGIPPEHSVGLLNYWSAGEVLGRVILCSFVDLQWVSVRNCITLTCVALAAAILLLVELSGYYLYAGCLLLIAALVSLEYVLINVLIIEYLGERRVTSCYSVGSLIAAPLLLLRPTLIGLFRDQLGSYDGLLILLASASAAFALLFALLEPLAVRRWPKCSGGQ